MKVIANLHRKQKYSRWRAATLIGVYVLIGIHIAHWLIKGNTLAPLEFNEVLYTIHLGIITAGFIFMIVTIIGSIIFGRFFCSWACHILALQDFSEWVLTKLKIKPKQIKSRFFYWVPIAAMTYLFIWPQIQRVINGTPFPALKFQTDSEGWASFITNDFWRNLPSIPVTLFTFFVCGFVIIYFLGTRSFCQMVCPYGALFSVADKLAVGKIKLTGDCNQCGLCTTHCSSHILVHKEIKEFGKVVNSNCLKDLDCVAVCPNDAISYGFTKPSFTKSLSQLVPYKPKYNFSLKEDAALVFLTLIYTLIYRGLYDAIPFLLSITLSVVFAYFTLVLIQLFYKDSIVLGRFTIKLGSKITSHGKYFLFLITSIIIFSIHSGWIHYHSYFGQNIYQEVVLNGSGASTFSDKNKLEISLNHLKVVNNWGIVKSHNLNRILAAIYLYKNDYENAQVYLEKMIDNKPYDNEARLRLSKIYFLSNNVGKAEEQLKLLIKNTPQNKSKKELVNYSEALLVLGHIEEKKGLTDKAIEHFNESYINNHSNLEAILALGVLHYQKENFIDAEKYLLMCNEKMANSALVHNNLSNVYLKLRNINGAIHHLQELIKLQPLNASAHYNLGMLMFQIEKYDEASKHMLKATTINPKYVKAHIALSKIYDENGNRFASEKHKKIADSIQFNSSYN